MQINSCKSTLFAVGQGENCVSCTLISFRYWNKKKTTKPKVCAASGGIVVQLTHSTHDDIGIGNANVRQQRQNLIHDLPQRYEKKIYEMIYGILEYPPVPAPCGPWPVRCTSARSAQSSDRLCSSRTPASPWAAPCGEWRAHRCYQTHWPRLPRRRSRIGMLNLIIVYRI